MASARPLVSVFECDDVKRHAPVRAVAVVTDNSEHVVNDPQRLRDVLALYISRGLNDGCNGQRPRTQAHGQAH
jgi:hypothetical protein